MMIWKLDTSYISFKEEITMIRRIMNLLFNKYIKELEEIRKAVIEVKQ